MSRKGENIYRRKDGRWEGRYLKGYEPDGRSIYGSVYGRSYGEVKDKLLPLKLTPIRASNRFPDLFGEYLMDWLEETEHKVKPATQSSYQRIIHQHILPALGGKNLKNITAQDVQRFVNQLKAGDLSAGSIRCIFRVLSAVMGKAAETGAMATDVCKRIVLPPLEHEKVQVLSRPEQEVLENAAWTDKNGICVLLALYTGMRLGEICALRWEDINLERRVIHVRQTAQRLPLQDGKTKTAIHLGTPKSRTSQRMIPLSNSMAEYLSAYRPESENGYVLTQSAKMAEPRVCQYRFHALLDRAGLRRINFHTLRHTFATRCMELHMDITTLSQLLGHCSVKLTLDTYTDSVWEHKAEAIQLLDSLGSTLTQCAV